MIRARNSELRRFLIQTAYLFFEFLAQLSHSFGDEAGEIFAAMLAETDDNADVVVYLLVFVDDRRQYAAQERQGFLQRKYTRRDELAVESASHRLCFIASENVWFHRHGIRI